MIHLHVYECRSTIFVLNVDFNVFKVRSVSCILKIRLTLRCVTILWSISMLTFLYLSCQWLSPAYK